LGLVGYTFCSEFADLPKRDQHGNVVIVTRISDTDTTKFSHSAALKTYFMVQDVIMLETGTAPGYIFLIDAKGTGFGHFSRLKFSYMKLYADYLQVFVCNAVFHFVT
jgi:hypothetical protein